MVANPSTDKHLESHIIKHAISHCNLFTMEAAATCSIFLATSDSLSPPPPPKKGGGDTTIFQHSYTNPHGGQHGFLSIYVKLNSFTKSKVPMALNIKTSQAKYSYTYKALNSKKYKNKSIHTILQTTSGLYQ
jgi:hypothetical protein